MKFLVVVTPPSIYQLVYHQFCIFYSFEAPKGYHCYLKLHEKLSGWRFYSSQKHPFSWSPKVPIWIGYHTITHVVEHGNTDPCPQFTPFLKLGGHHLFMSKYHPLRTIYPKESSQTHDIPLPAFLEGVGELSHITPLTHTLRAMKYDHLQYNVYPWNNLAVSASLSIIALQTLD